MASDKGRPLPKFGEWDVNNPASAEGFTVIFSKARDEKKSNKGTYNTGSAAAAASTHPSSNHNQSKSQENNNQHPDDQTKKWFCCF
ncbi:protein NOI4-like isoform X2 [Juglans regia]|uniref:Protein NOI4-like isoform X2 n=1 Tax=Juglans regia TaxID=51240 RepID=A0A2I4GL40_JUGRE|nr:protein NOI4-like isoform X2 [Juglans regia]